MSKENNETQQEALADKPEFTSCCGSYCSEAGCCVGLEEEEE